MKTTISLPLQLCTNIQWMFSCMLVIGCMEMHVCTCVFLYVGNWLYRDVCARARSTHACVPMTHNLVYMERENAQWMYQGLVRYSFVIYLVTIKIYTT